MYKMVFFLNVSWLMAEIGFTKLYLVGFRSMYPLKHNQVLHMSTENEKFCGLSYTCRFDGGMIP